MGVKDWDLIRRMIEDEKDEARADMLRYEARAEKSIQAMMAYDDELRRRGWRPISTYPGRETTLLLTTTEGDPEMMSEVQLLTGGDGIFQCIQVGRYEGDNWDLPVVGNPTHWMPLPHGAEVVSKLLANRQQSSTNLKVGVESVGLEIRQSSDSL